MSREAKYGPGVDCHNHIIDPVRFPFANSGGYRPRPDETGTREAFAAALDAHGMHRALLVQPSGYGIDNRAILDAIQWQPGRFKGVAVLDPSTTERDLEALGRKGIVGVRFNLPFDPQALFRPEAAPFLARLNSLGWFVQVHGYDTHWAAVAPLLRRSGARVLIDHMGFHRTDGGIDQKGFQAVLELGREAGAVVKLSAPFRSSARPPHYDDLDPFVAAILAAFGIERCVWGSDWPFINTTRRPSYAEVLAPLARWLPDARDRRAVLWDNPCRLFGFGGGVQP